MRWELPSIVRVMVFFSCRNNGRGWLVGCQGGAAVVSSPHQPCTAPLTSNPNGGAKLPSLWLGLGRREVDYVSPSLEKVVVAVGGRQRRPPFTFTLVRCAINLSHIKATWKSTLEYIQERNHMHVTCAPIVLTKRSYSSSMYKNAICIAIQEEPRKSHQIH